MSHVRLLFAIPHYHGPGPARGHGSVAADRRARRDVVAATITGLHQVFGPRQYLIDIAGHRALPLSGPGGVRLDVVVCTAGDRHLLADLDLAPGAYAHVRTEAEPQLLGFECQRVLGEALGGYDHYCYLEDDLLLHDPWFFVKLGWFTDLAGNGAILQPNRFELDAHGGGRKAYVDGDIPPGVTAPFQDVGDQPAFSGHVMREPVAFRRPLNPHSGCYFLNHDQLAHWSRQPHFLDRDTSFVGPLESAATLGVMRTFRIYKPAPQSCSFLEVEHAARQFISRIPGDAPAGR